MDLPRHEIDPGKQAQRCVALILMISGESRINAAFRRQVRRGRANRRHAGLLVVRDDCLPPGWLGRRGAGCLKDFRLFVNTEDLRHFDVKLGGAALDIATRLVWLDRLGAEDLATREAFPRVATRGASRNDPGGRIGGGRRAIDRATGWQISPLVAAALCMKPRPPLAHSQAVKVAVLKEASPNFVKTLKRAMFGRAGIELLRARMLPLEPPLLHRI
jgi:hypothetical protein